MGPEVSPWVVLLRQATVHSNSQSLRSSRKLTGMNADSQQLLPPGKLLFPGLCPHVLLPNPLRYMPGSFSFPFLAFPFLFYAQSVTQAAERISQTQHSPPQLLISSGT